jgi:hypothetical protein
MGVVVNGVLNRLSNFPFPRLLCLFHEMSYLWRDLSGPTEVLCVFDVIYRKPTKPYRVRVPKL